MSWRDTLQSRSEGGRALVGRFRRARFIVPGSDARVGRRTELHEYPLRDKPYVEDLGRSARRFEVEVFVDESLGGDYLAARDGLIAALEAPGPGTLIHPWYGTLQVTLAEPASVRESTREGGRATFRISFIEAGALMFPGAVADTPTAVGDAADALEQSAIDDFSATFSVVGQSADFVAALEEELDRTLADLEAVVGDVAGDIAALIRSPANMAVAMVGAVNQVGSALATPGEALGLYQVLFTAGENSPSVPTTTAARRQQARNVQAVHHLVRRAAVAGAAKASAAMDFSTRDDALATQRTLAAALDAQMEATGAVDGAPIDDSVYQRLAAVQAAMATDLRSRGARLPQVRTYTVPATLPALVLAYRVHGDATREAEIITRNNIVHPGFVAGGQELEVLSD